MKFQFFIKNLFKYEDLSKIYNKCKQKKIEEIVCTSGLLPDIVEEVPREDIVAIVDYPFGNSSFAARRADILYCIEMGVKKIEIPINVDFILSEDLYCFCEEFNELYEYAASKGAILKPLIDYRLLDEGEPDHDYLGDIIFFLKEEICIDALTINSGHISDYFPENYEMCRVFSNNQIKVTTCRELHHDDHESVLSKHAYKIRMSSLSSLNLIK